MSTTQGPERPPYVDELRDVAKRISPAFPDASSTLSAIADRLAVHPDQDPRLAAAWDEGYADAIGDYGCDIPWGGTTSDDNPYRAALAAGPNQTGTNA